MARDMDGSLLATVSPLPTRDHWQGEMHKHCGPMQVFARQLYTHNYILCFHVETAMTIYASQRNNRTTEATSAAEHNGKLLKITRIQKIVEDPQTVMSPFLTDDMGQVRT